MYLDEVLSVGFAVYDPLALANDQINPDSHVGLAHRNLLKTKGFGFWGSNSNVGLSLHYIEHSFGCRDIFLLRFI